MQALVDLAPIAILSSYMLHTVTTTYYILGDMRTTCTAFDALVLLEVLQKIRYRLCLQN